MKFLRVNSFVSNWDISSGSLLSKTVERVKPLLAIELRLYNGSIEVVGGAYFLSTVGRLLVLGG